VNRDPIGYAGSQWNVYEYVGGRPTFAVDPLGLKWRVARFRGSRALAIAEKGDTVDDLAKLVNLDPERYDIWLRPLLKGKLPESTTEPITEANNCKFSIPNTVFVGVGEMSSFARWATGNVPEDVKGILKRAGYKVVYEDWVRSGEWQINDVPLSTDLYGLVFFGHGAGKGMKGGGEDALMAGWLMIANNPMVTHGAIMPNDYKANSLGILIIKSCHADWGNWESKSSPGARAAGTVWVSEGLDLAFTTGGIGGAAEAAPSEHD